QVVLGEVEEAVDGPRFEPAPRQDLPGLFAMEQVVIAEQDDARVHHAEAGPHAPGQQLQPVGLSELAARQDLAEALALAIVLAGDQYPVSHRRRVQLIPDLANVAAEPFDRFHAEMTGRLHGRTGEGRDANVGEPQELLEYARH